MRLQVATAHRLRVSGAQGEQGGLDVVGPQVPAPARAACARRGERRSHRRARRLRRGVRPRKAARVEAGLGGAQRRHLEHPPHGRADRLQLGRAPRRRVEGAAVGPLHRNADRRRRHRLHAGHAVERLGDRAAHRSRALDDHVRIPGHRTQRRQRRGRARLRRHADVRLRARREDRQTPVEDRPRARERRVDRHGPRRARRPRLRLHRPRQPRSRRHAVGARREDGQESLGLGRGPRERCGAGRK